LREAPRRTKLNFMCRMTFADTAATGLSGIAGRDRTRRPVGVTGFRR
jgi:hypothetical protein